MGCDGIFERYVTDNQPLITKVANERKTGHKSEKILENLLDTLLAKDTSEEVGCDNMTAMMVEFI